MHGIFDPSVAGIYIYFFWIPFGIKSGEKNSGRRGHHSGFCFGYDIMFKE